MTRRVLGQRRAADDRGEPSGRWRSPGSRGRWRCSTRRRRDRRRAADDGHLPSPPRPRRPANVFRRDGDVWTIAYQGRTLSHARLTRVRLSRGAPRRSPGSASRRPSSRRSAPDPDARRMSVGEMRASGLHASDSERGRRGARCGGAGRLSAPARRAERGDRGGARLQRREAGRRGSRRRSSSSCRSWPRPSGSAAAPAKPDRPPSGRA